MSKGLHRLSSRDAINGEDSIAGYSSGHYLSLIPTEELYEVKKRLWWTLWTFAMWTAYNTGRIPTVRADDSRVTSELPSSTHDVRVKITILVWFAHLFLRIMYGLTSLRHFRVY